MTPQELQLKLVETEQRIARTAGEVVEFARTVVHVLRDHNAKATADELGRLVHLYDSEIAEGAALVKQDLGAFVELLRRAREQGL